jgi:putative membrane protein insertion efficiency factor
VSPRPSLAARAGIRAIRGYQVVMAGSSPRCRFAPSCSEYTREAIEVHGLGRGVWMGVRRVGRCHPWNPGGYDPVTRPVHDPNVRSASEG